MLLSPGDRVDRYEVIELLGTGGMGEVYRARDPKLARLVALKMLRVDRGAGTDGPARLLREARAVAALAHPNVLAVYDVGDVHEPEALRGLSYIAMELVVGRSLRSYLGDASVPMRQRVGWLRDVAAALGAAHDAGIVHRDVKPENVMVRVDGVVKVLDFGIARRAAAAVDAWSSIEGHSVRTAEGPPAIDLPTLTGQGAVVGTPFYMAPEQLRGETIDARADQFAWGVVAYTLLVGKPPWPGSDPIAVLTQIVSYDPPAPADVEPSLPRGVSDAIVRAMAKRREDRFASMAEVIAGLDGTREGAPFAPASPAAPLTPRARGPGWWRVAALAGVLVAAAGALAWRGREHGRGPANAAATVTATASGAACATNAECVHAHGGEAWHCNARRHECVPIASEDCKAYAEPHDAEAEDVVWLGGMYPMGFHDLDSERRAADLARQDFARALGPSAARRGPLHARPIALAMCDETQDETRAAKHLAEDVEAPAVLGFWSTPGAIQAISTELLPEHVLVAVSISQASELTRIPEPEGEPRLVWRTTLDHESTGRPLAKFVSDVLEPAARATGLRDKLLRVAAVGSRTIDQDVIGGFFRALRFNGKSAVDNGASFRQMTVDPDGGASEEKVVDALVDFAPHVVYLADHESALRVLDALEARWRTGPRPTYLTAPGWPPPIQAFAGRDASRRRRFFAVTNLSTTLTNAELVLRYNTAYPNDTIERADAPQPSYDAFYLLAYASYAIGDEAITGPALSKAIDRLLPPGRSFNVGPSSIYDAFATLRAGARIDLDGAIGSLDFDRATGSAPIDYAITCMAIDDRGAAAPDVDSGLVYDARADKLVGTLRCP